MSGIRRVVNYRAEVQLAVYEDEVHKQSENDAVMKPEPRTWDTHALFRAICFGFVDKFESKVLAVEKMEERADAEKPGGGEE
jgi:hypothetical protein